MKPPYYRRLFTSFWLPRIYDWWVFIGTAGMTRQLREQILTAVSKKPAAIIDLATGTGETALLLKKHFPQSTVQASDLSEGMLKEAETKAEQQNLSVEFSVQDAVKTTYKSQSADLVTISFAIHDLPHTQRLAVMREAHRLLRPGGVFVIHEYHMPSFIILRLPIYLQFFLVENKEAWGIFQEPLQEELREAGFQKTTKQIYFHGLAQVVSGVKE